MVTLHCGVAPDHKKNINKRLISKQNNPADESSAKSQQKPFLKGIYDKPHIKQLESSSESGL